MERVKNYCTASFLLILFGCSGPTGERFYESGVSYELARYRKSVVEEVVYNLSFVIPDALLGEISGEAGITFEVPGRVKKPLLLDFRAPDDYLRTLTINGKVLDNEIINDHIVIAPGEIRAGKNNIKIEFRAGEMSLNRNQDFLYTLLVPDRASTLFPCFDQPDIKARFSLQLSLPSEYEAMSNCGIISDSTYDGIRQIIFKEGHPISTYLFAFAAGKFERIERTIDGVEMEMLHRETNEVTVQRNLDDIFKIHYEAIRWMEKYTGISYPFYKFGFVLIPSFQYGGMEHPGSIFYRASSLFLEDNPTMNEKMSRASLIAHETSHIWFGDLVTMKWFDDVWLKEVFAGYMADKIVNPGFPEANHELRFLLTRYPAAYAVDRTRGANPIIQPLDNLKNAGSLYGGIIYNKAPIVMKHLEIITGDSLLRESLREYLGRFSYENAEWEDLVEIISEVSGTDLRQWSNIWVREAGMPVIMNQIEETNGTFRIWFEESDPGGLGRHWQQTLRPLIIAGKNRLSGNPIPGNRDSFILSELRPRYVIPDTTGTAYGFFLFDSSTADWFSRGGADSINSNLLRGTIWINSWENMINGIITPATFYRNALHSAINENDEQVRSYLVSRVSDLFWHHLSVDERIILGTEAEMLISERIKNENEPAQRRLWFNLYKSIATTQEGLKVLHNTWESGLISGTQQLSEEEMCTLALMIALKGGMGSKDILEEQLLKIENPDRKQKFQFLMPSVSHNQADRDNFFEMLKDPVNREREPWVIEGLGYLHHPLVSSGSVKYLRESLEMLEEIKQTGDIFFPASWINTILSGHSGSEAYSIVKSFLDSHPSYPADLRLKILQASDHIFRANERKGQTAN